MEILCALGDSITAGVGIPGGQSGWTDRIEKSFSNIKVVNLGVGGQTSSQGLANIDDILAKQPNVITIQYGMNDHCLDIHGQAKVSLYQFRMNLETMVSKLSPVGDIVFFTNHFIIEGNDNEYYYHRHPRSVYGMLGGANVWLSQYNQAIRDIAKSTGCGLVDMEKIASNYDPFLFLRSKLNSDVDDGVHPHSLGVRVYTEAIVRELEIRQPNWRKL